MAKLNSLAEIEAQDRLLQPPALIGGILLAMIIAFALGTVTGGNHTADLLVLMAGLAGGALMALATSGPSTFSERVRISDALPEGVPGALSLLNGRLIRGNGLLTMGRDLPTRIEGALEPRYEYEEGLPYRLIRGAVAVGFAFETVRDRETGRGFFLTVRAMPGERFVWTVLPLDRVHDVIPSFGPGQYDSVP